MKPIEITGASQRVSVNGAGEWCALYMCHKCGDEFAYSHEFCRTEKDAREESNTRFDVQQRRYCYRCGYKLTSLDDIPESAYIAGLNAEIDKLEAKRRDLIDEIITLRNCFDGQPEAARIAMSKGWIRMIPCDNEE